ncbi:MAG: hypothetical protein KKG59_07185 [Nanoarchaeota archaeon]|nr:hypothetical protein [Nanoarchaeota archaeon]
MAVDIINPYQYMNNHDGFHRVSVKLTTKVMESFYDIEYRNLDRLEAMGDQAFFLLPKHQEYQDLLLEGAILQNVLGRLGNYLMKGELPRILSLYRGIFIDRPKDTKKVKVSTIARIPKVYLDGMMWFAFGPTYLSRPHLAKQTLKDGTIRGMQLVQTQEGKVRRNLVYKIQLGLLQHDELLVVHPETTRKPGEKFQPVKTVLRGILDLQTQIEKSVPYLPLRIFYENPRQRKSKIIVDVGNPIIIPPDIPLNGEGGSLEQLTNHLMQEMDWVPMQ